jgi:hypothetical protein
MRTDGQTDKQTGSQADMTSLIVAFRNFANAPKKKWQYLYIAHLNVPAINNGNSIQSSTNILFIDTIVKATC